MVKVWHPPPWKPWNVHRIILIKPTYIVTVHSKQAMKIRP